MSGLHDLLSNLAINLNETVTEDQTNNNDNDNEETNEENEDEIAISNGIESQVDVAEIIMRLVQHIDLEQRPYLSSYITEDYLNNVLFETKRKIITILQALVDIADSYDGVECDFENTISIMLMPGFNCDDDVSFEIVFNVNPEGFVVYDEELETEIEECMYGLFETVEEQDNYTSFAGMYDDCDSPYRLQGFIAFGMNAESNRDMCSIDPANAFYCDF